MKKIFCFITALLFSFSISAQSAWNYVSPKPGSTKINPENNIAFRSGDRLLAESISSDLIAVSGTKSGDISGFMKLSVDGRTLIFLPDNNYQHNETISVFLQPGVYTEDGVLLDGISFTFRVRPIDIKDNSEIYPESENVVLRDTPLGKDPDAVSKSYNDLITYGNALLPENFPPATIVAYNQPAPEHAFYATEPVTDRYGHYAVILDNHGTPVFYREWPSKTVNFQVVANNQLIHKNGSSFVVLDDMYNIVDTLQAGNGYIS
jgi:hypothetical protein